MSSNNNYFNESQTKIGSGGLSTYTVSLINGIPPSSWQYVSTMNQHVGTTYSVDFAKIILGNGSNVAPSLGFSSSAGLYLGSSNTPTFNTQISSNGYKITSDTLPTILGYGISLTLQSGDTIIGQSAGSVMTGNNNTAVGVKALNLATAGDSNTACGWLSLGRLINDGYNTAIGALSLQNLTGGVSNIGLGYNSGISLKTGISSIFIGAYSGLLAGTDCDDGVCIGGSSKIVSNSIAIGFEAAASTSCVALGYRALKTGTNIGNTAIGNLALTLNTTGYYNTALGYSAFSSLLDGFQNTGIGSNVFPALTTGQDNSAVGDSSGGTVQTGRCNSFLGKSSQSTGIDTQYGLCLGYNSQTDSYGIAIGANAVAPANGCVVGTSNIYTTRIYGRVGINQEPAASVQFAVSGSMLLGSPSVLLDPANGLFNIQNPGGTGTKMLSGISANNTAHGYRTFNPNTQTGYYNCAFGYRAMSGTDPSVSTEGNTAIGTGALVNVSGGSNNTALGQNSGISITTGTNNTIIGHNSNVGGATDTNSVVVGYNVTGAGSNTTVIGNANTIATTIYGDINLVFLDYSSGTSTQSNSVGVDFAVQFGTLVSSKNITGKIAISGTGNTFFKNTSGKTVYWLVSYHVSMTTGSTLPVNLKTWITTTADTATLNGNYSGHNSHVGNVFNSTSYTLKNSGCAVVEVLNNSYVIIVANEYSTGGAISIGGATSDLYNRISIKQLG